MANSKRRWRPACSWLAGNLVLSGQARVEHAPELDVRRVPTGCQNDSLARAKLDLYNVHELAHYVTDGDTDSAVDLLWDLVR